MTAVLEKSHVDLEASRCGGVGGSGGGDQQRHQASASADHGGISDLASADGSCSFENNNRATRLAGTDISGSQMKGDSSVPISEFSIDVDLEVGTTENKVHLAKIQRDCRICHMSLDPSNQESGVPIELGCSCKDDLAAAHKQCAEAWFKIRGNKTCEICGSTARNVVGVNEVEMVEQWNEANDAAAAIAPIPATETRRFWQGHRFLNFLLACMVFAFVISWLFHFNVPS